MAKILIVSLILSCFASLMAFIPSVSASESVVTSLTSGSLYSPTTTRVHPSTESGKYSAYGSTTYIASTSDLYLTKISLIMYRQGSPNAIIRMDIVNPSNVSQIYETSTTNLAASSLTTGWVWYNFTFSGTYLMPKAADFRFNVYCYSAVSISDANYYVAGSTNAATSDFDMFKYANSAWASDASYHLYQIVYADVTPAATPTPTPNPSTGGVPVGTANLAVDAYADCNVSWRIQGESTLYYEGIFNLPIGTVIEMLCTPDEGYYFDYWWAIWEDGSTELYVNPLHFTLYNDLSLTGYVDAAPQSYQTLTLQDNTGGRIYCDYSPENWTGAIRFFAGDYSIATNTTLTIGGLPNTGYQFYRLTLAWNIGGVTLSNIEYDNPITVGLIGALTAKAYFTASSLFPTPSGGATDGGTLGTVLTILTSVDVIALFIMIIIGAVGYYMAGAWGFFAGINLAAILLFIGSVFPLWGVVVLVIVDALLLYGKVSASRDSGVSVKGE